jgi:hypothetical protein
METIREQIKAEDGPMNLYVSRPDGAGPFLRWCLSNIRTELTSSWKR